MQKQIRKNDRCMNCGEIREIAAHGLCFACYRRNVRERERPDAHTPQERAHHKRLLKAYSTVMQGLLEIGVRQEDALEVKAVLRPHLTAISHLIDEQIGGGGQPHDTDDSPAENDGTTATGGDDEADDPEIERIFRDLDWVKAADR